MTEDHEGYSGYWDWYDNGPGSEAFIQKQRKSEQEHKTRVWNHLVATGFFDAKKPAEVPKKKTKKKAVKIAAKQRKK